MEYKGDDFLFCDTQVLKNESLKKYSSMGVGGNAKYFAKPTSLYAVRVLTEYAKSNNIQYKVIGKGANIVFSDNGYDGLIISLEKIKDIYFSGSYVRAMSGASIADLSNFNLHHNLTGLPELRNIPSSIGGAVVNNAGAFGVDISTYLKKVEILSAGKLKVLDKENCNFSYRKSRFLKKGEILLSAYFDFPLKEENYDELYKKYSSYRKETQPHGKCSGCIFKNPKGLISGKLIEDCGLKGFSLGGAEVSPIHANFIVNKDNATANDIFMLKNYIKVEVLKKFNVLLKEEVEFVGDFL